MTLNVTNKCSASVMKMHLFLFFLLLAISSCSRKQEDARPNAFVPKVVEAKGIAIPPDSMGPPVVTVVNENDIKTVMLKPPVITPANTIAREVGALKEYPLVPLRISTPTHDTDIVRRDYPITDSTWPAGIPQTTVVKDLSGKDQNSQSFSILGKIQGLRHGYVNTMIEDRNGNLWMGTFGAGVTRYDGRNFTHITEKEGLPDNWVQDLSEDKNGDIWIQTAKGTCKYDGKNFTMYFDEKKQPFYVSTDADAEGNIWIDTEGQYVRYHDGRALKGLKLFGHEPDIGIIANVFQDSKRNLWFASGSLNKEIALTKYDGRSFTHFSATTLFATPHFTKITEDKAGNIWLGSAGNGALRITPRHSGGSTAYTVTQFTDTTGLISNDVRDVLGDKQGNIWFSCNEAGVCKYDGTSITRYTEKEGLSFNDVAAMVEDKAGNMWFATQNNGVSKFDGNLFTHISGIEGAIQQVINIALDSNKNLLIGSNNGIISYDGKRYATYTGTNNYRSVLLTDKKGNVWFRRNGLAKLTPSGEGSSPMLTVIDDKGALGGVINQIIEDRSGALWFAMWNIGGFVRFDGKSFTFFPLKGAGGNVSSIFQDNNGEYWIGTFGGGLYTMKPHEKDGKTTYTFTHFTEKEGLPHNAVNCFLQDKRGDLWIGTNAGGVCKYDGKTFTHFTESEGLVNNGVLSLLEDKHGNIWFGTRFGVSKLSSEKSAKLAADAPFSDGETIFKNYTYEDGFWGVGCYRNALCQDSSGTIWFATTDRFTALHPEGDVENTIPPNIQITNVNLFSEAIPWAKFLHQQDWSLTLGNGVKVSGFEFSGTTTWYGLPENLSLAHNNNYLTFTFVGITLKSPKRVRYRYKLEGIDDNWSAITASAEAPYGNIPPGTYTFKVKAMNDEGYWSKEAGYTFTIRPPWWKTWWAYGLYFITITGSIWYYIVWRERMLRLRQKVLERTVRQRTAEVVAEKQEVEKQREEAELQREEAEKQRERSDTLLLNILPAEVAEELKEKGAAEAKNFDNVTVLFSDFVGFTKVSESLTPQELVNELHACFKTFDEICGKYNIEKIKTIGDAYLAVCGLPLADEKHAENVVKAALEIQGFMENRSKEMGEKTFEVRIGINSGSVVAGIVGVKKFAYDIWGDTVNTAARMEQHSKAGKINISETTYALVKDNFTCEYRGEIDAKNKGKLKMYFVENL